jgi:LuxR family maltose regulon positive regulatory protein
MAADYMGRVGSAAFTARFGLKDLRAGLGHLTEPELALQPSLSQARALALVQEAPGALTSAPQCGGRGADAEAIILDAFLTAYADVRPDPVMVEQCRGFAEAEDALDIACRGLARCFLCWESLRTARLDEARLWADISQTDFDAVDAAYGAVFVHLHAAAIAFQANTLERGRAHLAQAEQIIKLFFPDDERLFNLVWLSGAWIDHDLGVVIPSDDLAACVDYVRDHEGWLDTLWTSVVLASRQALQRGDDRRALDFLERGLATAANRNAPRLTWSLRCERVRLLTLVGDLDAAGREANALSLNDTARAPLDAEPLTWVEVTNGWLNAARLAVHAGDLEEAVRLAEAVAAFAEKNAVPRLAAAALVLKAAAARPQSEAAALALVEAAHALFEGLPSVALFNDEAVVTGVTARAAPPVPLPSLSPAAAASRLTQREMELMALVAQGLLNKQIAYELGVTETTIKFHMRNIYRKLGAQNRVQALMRMG